MIDPKHIKAIQDLLDFCNNNVPYFGFPEECPGSEDLATRTEAALAALKRLERDVGDGVMVQIALEGGLVQGGTANVPMDIVVFDYDTGMGDDEQMDTVPQEGVQDTQAWVTEHSARVSPKFIKRVKAFMSEKQDA